jgi:WD40 repeat protein
MNYIFFIFCLINLAASHIFFAMDFNNEKDIPLQTIYQTKQQMTDATNNNAPSKEQLVDAHNAIQQKYDTLFYNMFGAERENFDIIRIAIQHCGDNINESAITELINENYCFKSAIDYFCILAQKNLHDVTFQTLTTIQDVKVQQPTPQLNQLPRAIKKYVMDCATNNPSYNIMISTDAGSVKSFDIHNKINLLATASDDGTFRLWDLSQAKQIHIFPGKANKGLIKFTPDGSRLITVTRYQQNPDESHITLWDVPSREHLHTITIPYYVKDIALLDNESNIINISSMLTIMTPFKLLSYALTKNNDQFICLGECKINKCNVCTNPGSYVNFYSGSKLSIEKKCPQLYFCEQAIKNTSHTTSPNITKTSIYQSLTPYEKGIVDNKLNKKLLGLLV